jgi:hypothetical protein
LGVFDSYARRPESATSPLDARLAGIAGLQLMTEVNSFTGNYPI